MSRDPALPLEEIVAACDRIGRYTIGMTRDAFVADSRTADAVIRNLEIIGEAAKQIPDSLRAKYVDVPWRRMTALPDVLVHGYFRVDLALVWDIVQREVPTVRVKIAAILATTSAG